MDKFEKKQLVDNEQWSEGFDYYNEAEYEPSLKVLKSEKKINFRKVVNLGNILVIPLLLPFFIWKTYNFMFVLKTFDGYIETTWFLIFALVFNVFALLISFQSHNKKEW